MIDFRPIHRELAVELADGMIFQLEGFIRFTERGEDEFAFDALQRAAKIFRQAAEPVNAIKAEGARLSIKKGKS